jgi:hypothetical protein
MLILRAFTLPFAAATKPTPPASDMAGSRCLATRYLCFALCTAQEIKEKIEPIDLMFTISVAFYLS